MHLIAGIEHAAKSDGHWKFTRWDVVDLSQVKVKLNAEFQGSNRDLYRPKQLWRAAQNKGKVLSLL